MKLRSKTLEALLLSVVENELAELRDEKVTLVVTVTLPAAMFVMVTADEDTPALVAIWETSVDRNVEENEESEKLLMSSDANVKDPVTSCVVVVPGELVGAGVGAKVGDSVVGAVVGTDVGTVVGAVVGAAVGEVVGLPVGV